MHMEVTSQIAYEVVETHFALRFDVGGVHVRVEEDHSKRQDEDGVRVMELLHHIGVTHAVPLAAKDIKDRTTIYYTSKRKYGTQHSYTSYTTRITHIRMNAFFC